MKTKTYHITTELQQLISAEQAYHYGIIPVEKSEGIHQFITHSKNIENLQSELTIILGIPVNLINEDKDVIQNLLQRFYRKTEQSLTSSLHYSEDFLLNIIQEAQRLKSSDIHFEVFENNGRVRFRIDGKLIERYIIPNEEYPIIVNRLKILAGADIAEKRLPQDGRINFKTNGDNFDIRVSILPSLFGEKVVLRLLTKDSSNLDLKQLGFHKDELALYLEGIKKPSGIILISGPTGSGKTTSLYATLKLLNKTETNILTIEDPIEYTIEGITQVQLKESIGLDFQKALKTFLRQDPDIIMVGEIRDVATANMAIRAALTGHLVLATIHTNSAWDTISRLIDMDIPPFLIANTLTMSVAQRLVRKLCNECKEKTDVDASVFPKNFNIPDNLTQHYQAKGCPNCYHTGYSGRQAIYEIIPIKEELIEKIKNKELNIDTYRQSKKLSNLKEKALSLVLNGITSIEEVYSLLID